MLARIQKLLNDIPLSVKGILVVAIPVAMLLITILLMAWYEKESKDAHDMIQHTLEVKANLALVQALVSDSETAIRGYRLWDNRAYLEPFYQAKTEIGPALKKLSGLIDDNPEQVRRMAELERNVKIKMDLTEQAIPRDRPSSVDAPSVVQSRETMATVRRLVNEMDTMETVLLEQRNRVYANVTRQINYSMVALFLLGTIGGIAAAYINSTSIVNRISQLQAYSSKVERMQEASWEDSGQDEIGHLGRSLTNMTATLLNREKLLHDAQGELQEANRNLEVLLEEARTANQELESFSYSVSHDLRAPLRHVSGFSQLMLKNSESLDPKNRRYLDIIIGSIQQMGVLIDDLLAFSRMGRTAIKAQPIDLNGVISDVLDRLSPEMADRKIDFKIDTLPTIQGDPAMILLVVQNLIGNALKYSRAKENTEIKISSESSPETHMETIIFEDNGIGFDMKYVDKLFGVFQRLHHTEDYEGTGIGLANVRRIIHRHGGKVSAEGKVGEGAKFSITLPAYNETESQIRKTTKP